jgi:hypothetical protein
MGQCHLPDAPQPLVPRMRYDLEYQWIVYGDEAIDRVVDDLPECPLELLNLKGAGP